MTESAISPRIRALKDTLLSCKPAICTERTLIWTDYFKNAKQNALRSKPMPIQMAEALSKVLAEKTVRIYPGELIVGNFTSKRIGGSILPELVGLPVMMDDLFFFSSRETNPLQLSWKERFALLRTIPFWATRFLGWRAHKPLFQKMRFLKEQLQAKFFVANEVGGIAHICPDYSKLIHKGTEGIFQEANLRQKDYQRGTDEWTFLQGVKIVCEGLAHFGERYADAAKKLAETETDPTRKSELRQIEAACRSVPRKPATTLQEALQSILFAQIALNLESLDQAITPGRLDQILYPFYDRDVNSKNALTRDKAKDLIACFCIKFAELIPIFSRRITRIHGGMFNGQVVTIGGVDEDGKDATNDLSYIFLEVMDELRLRQPNFHARVCRASPKDYLGKITSILAKGATSPALYSDEVIINTMVKRGYSLEDARNFTAIGCVELGSTGKSFSSTDAALVNIPILIELAMNEGRQFGSSTQYGANTKAPGSFASMKDVLDAFEVQLKFLVARMSKDLTALEIANREFHPTALTSMLLSGCLESAKCSTAGGAKYNFSGIQGVGVVDAGEALYSIEQIVFVKKLASMSSLVDALAKNFRGHEPLHKEICALKKFGNDEPEVDRYVDYVFERFNENLSPYRNSRGGQYVPGLYSVTVHNHFGSLTGALPNGRLKGRTFSSGISPRDGLDTKGPTAMINSLNKLDFSRAANGVNVNWKFDCHTLRGRTGEAALTSLIRTYFNRGGMQVQINVLDPQVLIEARKNPGLHPNLLVRVSGYSAYFNDLTPELKDEIIRRTVHRV